MFDIGLQHLTCSIRGPTRLDQYTDITAKKNPFSGRQVDLFSVAVGVAGNETDSKGAADEIAVANASMPLSLCGETGADATERVDDKGGARIVNFDASCWADAFFLGAAIRGEQRINKSVVRMERHPTPIGDIMLRARDTNRDVSNNVLDVFDACRLTSTGDGSAFLRCDALQGQECFSSRFSTHGGHDFG